MSDSSIADKPARTQDEIVARFDAADDFFGFGRDVLLAALDYEHAKPHLKDDVTAETWATAREAVTLETAASYLDFAYGKASNHRGISAGRSVEKLTEYAWLLGRDDVVAAMDAAEYQNYGVPKLKAFAEGMGLPWSADEDLNRMALGEPCSYDCQSGCAL